ncbi:MAG: CHAT domain-containing protein [Acidobacteriota bacterium]
MRNYEDFEIVIEKATGSTSYAVNVRQACGGKCGDASSTFQLSEVAPMTAAAAADAGDAVRNITIKGGTDNYSLLTGRALKKDAAAVVGRQLSKALFKDQVLELWGQCQRYAPLRIRLDLSSAPELASLPWEYLSSTAGDNFVALDDKTTFVRYLRTAGAIDPIRVVPPLRVLVMASVPDEVRALDTGEEISRIRAALAGISADNIEVVVLRKASTRDLTDALQKARADEKPFHVFHFIGHGAFDKAANEGVLLFEDVASTQAVTIGHDELARILQPFRADLRLLILNACETARHSVSDVYSSVAAKAMQIAEIPAAIAMQFEISDKAAITFSQAFYEQLVQGEPIEYAVDVGRRRISQLEGAKDEWATPVLYLRADKGDLFEIRVPEPPKNLEGHYFTLKSLMQTCNLVVFLGLDVNISYRPYHMNWKPGTGLPSTEELAAYLVKEFNLPTSVGPLSALAQRLQVFQANLSDSLAFIFAKAKKPTKLHRVLGDLTKKITDQLPAVPKDNCHCSMLFVTTTYDRALEQAFIDAGITDFHTVCYGQGEDGKWLFTHGIHTGGSLEPSERIQLAPPNNPNVYPGLRNSAPVILKLPGEVGGERKYAISEDDFLAFVNQSLSELLPADMLGQIQSSRHLYLGYDLQNWTLRMLWTRLCENQPKTNRQSSYAVFESKESPAARFWDKKEVTIADARLDDYLAGIEKYIVEAIGQEAIDEG